MRSNSLGWFFVLFFSLIVNGMFPVGAIRQIQSFDFVCNVSSSGLDLFQTKKVWVASKTSADKGSSIIVNHDQIHEWMFLNSQLPRSKRNALSYYVTCTAIQSGLLKYEEKKIHPSPGYSFRKSHFKVTWKWYFGKIELLSLKYVF